MSKKKYIPETDISFGIRSAFNIEWKGLKLETSGTSVAYEIARGISEAKERFETDVGAQESWMWAQRAREGLEVQHAYDQVVREDAEFVEAWDLHIK